MKNWKKLLATGLSTALILGTLASCGGGNTSSPAASSGAAASGSGSDASSTTTTNFPDGKSLSMIIHASPGGLSDTNARFIAQMVSDELGVPFPATNMTGGSGVVAMTYVKESTPDGYTVGYLPCELAMVKAQGLTEIIEPSAFDMIYACNIQPAAITVSADSEWDSIEDLVAWCKEHPGELQVGTSGTGSVWHIAADAFAKAAGIKADALKAQVEEFNKVVKAKADPVWSRYINNDQVPLVEGPWYVCELQPKVHHCMGGLVTDDNCEVLDVRSDKPIGHLFAAGEATGGVHGAVRLGSVAILDCLVFGRLAGQKVAAIK